MHAAAIVLLMSGFSSLLCAEATQYAYPPAEHAIDVAALQPLRALIRASNVPLAGWTNGSSPEPCSAANCSTQHGVGIPQCAWEGVACQNGRVTTVRLACGERHPCVNRIHGRLPASLGSLTALQVLFLRDNALTGSLPQGEGWSSLVQLDLHGNSIASTLPPQWGMWLPQLTDLDLADNQLTGDLPWSWGELQSISQIDLSNNKLSGGIPMSWGSLHNLKVLLLKDNCAMCGGLPMLHAKLSARNTSLGAACNPNGGCGASSYSTLMIALSILLGSFALCLLQRHICWRCRVAGLLAEAQQQESLARLEAGQAGGPNHSAVRRIPSFEVFVELRDNLPAGKSRHGNSAAQSVKDPPQQQQQMQQWHPSDQAGADRNQAALGSAGSSWQDQQQLRQVTESTGSVPCPASPAQGKDLQDLQPHFSVIVMPDGQNLALAIPEIDAAENADATARSSQGNTGQASAGSNAQQQQQSRMQRAGRAVLRAVVYLFVQPVPRASEVEQTYVAGHQQGNYRTTLL